MSNSAVRNPSKEEALSMMKDFIMQYTHKKKILSRLVNDEHGDSWRTQPAPNTNLLGKKQKIDLLKKAKEDALSGFASNEIMFKSQVSGFYHSHMFKSKRAKIILKEYARITKRTNSKKQKQFLEYIGFSHYMNRAEYRYYRDKFRKHTQFIVKGFYDFETETWNLPDYVTGTTKKQ